MCIFPQLKKVVFFNIFMDQLGDVNTVWMLNNIKGLLVFKV